MNTAGASAPGRPRSDAARLAVLHAVDDMPVEAVRHDAKTALAIEPRDSTEAEFEELRATIEPFLTASHAGAAYRALVGEAQHDTKVAELIGSSDVLVEAAIPVVNRAIARGDLPSDLDPTDAGVRPVGAVFFRVLTGTSC